MMKRATFVHAFTAVLFAFFWAAGVSAQIRFAGDENGLSVNGKIIDSSGIPESLYGTVMEHMEHMSIRQPRVFSFYDPDGSFPMRVKINDVTYEIWADRIIESCETGNVRAQIGIGRDSVTVVPTRPRRKASGPQIEPSFLVNSFKGDGQQVELIANYGIPLESIYDHSGETMEVSADVRTFLVDDRGEALAEFTQNINGLATNQVVAFPDRHLWVDTQQMQMPSGAYELLVVQTVIGRDRAIVALDQEITVPDYNQTGVILSDIMLAYSVEQTENGIPLNENEIIRKDLSILPAPRNVYLTEWPIYLYFEIYGLTLNAQGKTDYDVEIKLEPEDTSRGVRRLFRRNRGGEGVSVSYRESGSQSEESLYQILDINDQKTGPYTLTLVVRDNETGEESSRTQSLFLERSPCSE